MKTAAACSALLGRKWTYQEANLRRPEEVGPFLDEVTSVLAGLGYSPQDQFGVRLALEEAIVNGLRHGNGGDPRKRVRVGYRVDAEALLAEVEDEGPGFDRDAVPDPTRLENLERPGGRGLLLMHSFMTWVRYHGRGNRVSLCKRPSVQPPAA
jgi:serine/threonine-protein kinase RsbW